MKPPSKQATKRLGVEYKAITKEPPPFVWARPDEQNILSWHYILRGPTETPYEGGEFWGVVTFPADYPFAPPEIKMMTPSGRFSPNTAICTSFSNFHPGSWNPAWSAASIFTGLLSFMVGDEHTTGSIRHSDAERKAFAAASHAWNLQQPKFRSMFEEYATPELRPVPNMGPPPPAAAAQAAPTAGASEVTTSTHPGAGVGGGQVGVDDPLGTTGAAVGGQDRAKAGGSVWRGRVGVAGAVLLVSWAVVKLMEV